MKEKLQQIEAYLSGQMSVEESTVFELEMQSQAEIAEQVREIDLLFRSIERIGIKEDIQKARAFQLRKKILWRILIGGMLFLLFYLTYSNWDSTRTFNYQPRSIDLTENRIDFSSSQSLVSINAKGEKQTEVLQAVDTIEKLKSYEKYKPEEVEAQFFQIATNKDTLLYGKEGTALLFKAHSLDTKQASVLLSLKEYYRTSDIVFSPLSTESSNYTLLESGGMVHLEVKDTLQQAVKLKDGQVFTIAFPRQEETDGMNLYEGKENLNKVTWSLSKEISTKEESKLASEPNETILLFSAHGGEVPIFLNHEGSVLDCVLKELRYPLWAVEGKEEGRISISYRVSKAGIVLDYRIVRAKKVSPRFYSYLGQTILSLPQHLPYKHQGKTVQVTNYTLDVPINAKGKKGYTDKEIKEYRDSLFAVRKAERVIGEKEIQAKNREKAESLFGDTSIAGKEQLLSELEYYTFSSTGFGWLNCDRSLNLPICKNFKVLGLEEEEGLRLRMIVHRVKTVIAPREKDGPYCFPNAPMGERVSLFALQIRNGKAYAALEELIVSDQNPQLTLKETSIEGMEAYARQMNRIYEQ